MVQKLHPPNTAVLTFSAKGTDEDDTFLGDLAIYSEVLAWATDRCIPLVREITFQVRDNNGSNGGAIVSNNHVKKMINI